VRGPGSLGPHQRRSRGSNFHYREGRFSKNRGSPPFLLLSYQATKKPVSRGALVHPVKYPRAPQGQNSAPLGAPHTEFSAPPLSLDPGKLATASPPPVQLPGSGTLPSVPPRPPHPGRSSSRFYSPVSARSPSFFESILLILKVPIFSFGFER